VYGKALKAAASQPLGAEITGLSRRASNYTAVMPAAFSLATSSSTDPTLRKWLSRKVAKRVKGVTDLCPPDPFLRLGDLEGLKNGSHVHTEVGRLELLNRFLLCLHNVG
jgi:hypothetical protein